MRLNQYHCQIIEHEGDEVMGFCLNYNCQKESAFCFKCYCSPIHSNHLNDCLRFKELYPLLSNFNTKFEILESEFQDWVTRWNQNEHQFKLIQQYKQGLINIKLKNIGQKVQSNLLLVKDKKHQLSLLIGQLEQMNFQNQRDFKKQIKTFYKLFQSEQNWKEKFNRMKIQYIDILAQFFKINNKKIIPLSLKSKSLCDMYIAKGDQLFNKNDYIGAIKYYDRVVLFDINHPQIYNFKGRALHRMKKYEDAIKYFDLAICKSLDHSTAFNNKGESLRCQEKYYEAIQCYDQSITLNPQNPIAYKNKGYTLYLLKSYSEAIECYDKLIFLDSTNAIAYNNKGISLHCMQKYPEAINCFNEAIRLDPKFQLAVENKQKSLQRMNGNHEVIKTKIVKQL